MRSFFKRRKRTDPRQALAEVLEGYELPSFPGAVTRILSRLSDEEVSLKQIADEITLDPGLSVFVLRTVNSAAFGLRCEVRSVHHAVQLLGRSQIESMLISIGVRTALPDQAAPGFDPARFWTAAARRAAIAGAVAEKVQPDLTSECFTAALLQDMALPVLARHRPREYTSILEAWHAGEGDLRQLEREALDWDHAAVGAWMCEAWGMPNVLVDAIGTHHEDHPEGPLPASKVVAVLPEEDAERHHERVAERIRSWFGLGDETARDLIEVGVAGMPEIERMLRM